MILPEKVLILGSGALKIGQAGEFDYSGSQAIKALKEEKIKTVLVNPNIATIQTSKGFADQVYFLPINPYFVEKIIEKERPDGILLNFGGQTALNCGLSLAQKGIFEKYDLKVLGTQIEAIQKTESRKLFAASLRKVGLNIPRSFSAGNIEEALLSGEKIGYPVVCRAGFSLGGQGSSVVKNKSQLKKVAKRALALSPEILIEECLYGWKEIEYEVMRDCRDNCITVCNMENFDPMGIHTGESIVVSPSQTLTNNEYFLLREMAIKAIRFFKIVGECNIQFALHPQTGEYRIIEVNARLSRSSALASKVTGYPLAFIAAKLSLGFTLDELKNSVTKTTGAFFEPALDYLAVKIPRWDFEKFGLPYQTITTEMQSVGEVMAIGRTFPEVLQKAVRMLNQGHEGIIDGFDLNKNQLQSIIRTANSKRIFQIAASLLKGVSAQKIAHLTKIDYWFIAEIKKITDFYLTLQQKLSQGDSLSTQGVSLKEILKEAKRFGFSDAQLAKIFKTTRRKIGSLRIKFGIIPVVKQIDTLAAEYPAETNYLYLTYHGIKEDLNFRNKKQIMVLASGPYCIGSSVEFDWCAVNTVATLRKNKNKTILVNCNPETVSTDYDITDKLYFEELSLERVLDICRKEKPLGVILSVGGQIPNNLALSLAKEKIRILGTKADDIDKAEDRQKFSALLGKLSIDQPVWQQLSSSSKAIDFAQQIEFPVIARPSYVLSGKSMIVIYSKEELVHYLNILQKQDIKIVISKFIQNAKEIEADLVAKKGEIILCAISEHIENAGVHSGDASIVFPPQKLYIETIRRIKDACKLIAKALNINGPANIQFLAKDNQIKVIECNLRASRTFPFISKMCDKNFIEMATLIMLKKKVEVKNQILDLDYVGVKVPQFSFSRLHEVDPILRVEMASTGEAACLGEDVEEAYLKALIATDQQLPQTSVLISLGGEENKLKFLEEARILFGKGLKIYATHHTGDFLTKNGIRTEKLFKIYEKQKPNIADFLAERKIDLVINITDPDFVSQKLLNDDYQIRRSTVDFGVPLFTNLQAAKLFVQAFFLKKQDDLKVNSYADYFKKM